MSDVRIEESFDGFRWVNHGVESDDHLAFGGHEPALRPVLEGLSDPDKVYLNVGAHVGTWAIRMAERNKQVFALEANQGTYRTLQENVALNDLAGYVVPVWTAVWDEVGHIVEMVDANDKATGGSTRVVVAAETNPNVTVTTTLDSLFANDHGIVVGLISMDVEGAEARVLAGAKDLIMRDRPNMLIELHEGHPGTAADLRQQVYDLLDSLGYEYNSIFLSDPEEHIVCTPREKVSLDEPEAVKAGR